MSTNLVIIRHWIHLITNIFSKKSCRGANLLLPSVGQLGDELREFGRSQIPGAGSGEAQSDNGGGRRRDTVLHRGHHTVRVRREDMQQAKAPQTGER